MTSALNVVPETTEISTGVKDAPAMATGLESALADTYRLLFKTHATHWNVEGPLFFSVHNLTEEQYENLFEAADVLAERIRALGQLAPATLSSIVANSVVQDEETPASAGEMCEDLAADHERVAHRLHALIKIAGEHGDPVTEDLATERAAFHEKAAWMLRSIAKS
ncbi:DNA starvation/stationary phase protection protein [Roseobacter cerasinus]|uniref:DNA starvation/stationary phase protection protein n=1 Tax=Roseobacter cerasinus TaxID=2602289 RepID=A0A640VPW0_9RHOB|nr:DNA starvation/stationary phase protection protein [Roseobacter cerasinus]GFE49490.1 DNA starvation/stationary phase protection protein [Roseobacter cerasinus]